MRCIEFRHFVKRVSLSEASKIACLLTPVWNCLSQSLHLDILDLSVTQIGKRLKIPLFD